jgi:hypothetical protein
MNEDRYQPSFIPQTPVVVPAHRTRTVGVVGHATALDVFRGRPCAGGLVDPAGGGAAAGLRFWCGALEGRPRRPALRSHSCTSFDPDGWGLLGGDRLAVAFVGLMRTAVVAGAMGQGRQGSWSG